MKLTLTKTIIDAHGVTMSELDLRELDGNDLIDCGIPVRQIVRDDGSTEVEMNMPVIAKFISRMANIPPSSVRAMDPGDQLEAAGLISGFFGRLANRKKLSTGTSS